MREHTASRTAHLVAEWLHFQLHHPDTAHLVDPIWCKMSTAHMQANSLRTRAWNFLVKKHLTHKLYDKLVGDYYQSFTKHLLFRKLWVERQVLDFCQTHPDAQVVIIGAGFDTLAVRLAPQMPKTDFIEIDHPATQKEKQRFLAKLPSELAAYRAPLNLKLIPADLSRTALPKVLPRTQLPTLFIMEGLLMYLPEPTVKKLFDNLSNMSPNAMAAFTFLIPWQTSELPYVVSKMTTAWLKLWGEPFEWVIAQNQLTERVTAWHWRTKEVATSASEASDNHQFAFKTSIAEQFCLAQAEASPSAQSTDPKALAEHQKAV